MKQVAKRVSISFLAVMLSMVFVLAWNYNSNVLFAKGQGSNAPTLIDKGDYGYLDIQKKG
jgi:hypothetical protein